MLSNLREAETPERLRIIHRGKEARCQGLPVVSFLAPCPAARRALRPASPALASHLLQLRRDVGRAGPFFRKARGGRQRDKARCIGAKGRALHLAGRPGRSGPKLRKATMCISYHGIQAAGRKDSGRGGQDPHHHPPYPHVLLFPLAEGLSEFPRHPRDRNLPRKVHTRAAAAPAEAFSVHEPVD